MDKGGQDEKPKVVVDASVVAKWVIPGEPWDAQAERLKEKIVYGEVKAYAPTLLLYELASVILKATSMHILKFNDGVKAIEAIGQLGIDIQPPSWNDMVEILNITSTTGMTVYDSSYLHLSKRVGGKLITADKELREKGKTVAKTLLLNELNL